MDAVGAVKANLGAPCLVRRGGRHGIVRPLAAREYIAIVGITYSLLLRHMWNPQGTQKIADVLLHDVVPVLPRTRIRHIEPQSHPVGKV